MSDDEWVTATSTHHQSTKNCQEPQNPSWRSSKRSRPSSVLACLSKSAALTDKSKQLTSASQRGLVLRMESQVLQTSGLTSWASLKPRCPSHARRTSPALPRLAAAQICNALRSCSLVRFPAAAFDLHQLAVSTPSTREAACLVVLGRACRLVQVSAADVLSPALQNASSPGQGQWQQQQQQRFLAEKRCLQRLQSATEVRQTLPETPPTDNIASLEKILEEKGECGVGSFSKYGTFLRTPIIGTRLKLDLSSAGWLHHKLEEGKEP